MKDRFKPGSIQLLITNYSLLILLFSACSVEKKIARSVEADVLTSKALQTAHVGISIFDPATDKYLYNYQGDKYFVPASNTKIPTCYAAMKYLGDSLVAARYLPSSGKTLFIKATGDPTFLHPDFGYQPLLSLLKNYQEIKVGTNGLFKELGNGWSWNDYDEYYMTERNSMPLFGNVVWLSEQPIWPPGLKRDTLMDTLIYWANWQFWVKPKYFADKLHTRGFNFEPQRDKDKNRFYVSDFTGVKTIPFVTANALEILSAVLDKPVGHGYYYDTKREKVLHSQPTDSLLKPMMHRSDNFFAEQALLMVANEHIDYMNDEKIIDTLLKTDFKDLPQKPRWADGSGLSRYNLFTPQDFVAILNKMKNEFGMERIKVIFPTGGEGTISNYYKADSGYIFAKTGTLSGVVAFSGFLYTKKGKLLIFSTLVNNHQASATDVRRAVEKFIRQLREAY